MWNVPMHCFLNNLSNKRETFRNQQASLAKEPEFLHLFIYINVYTQYIVHIKSARKIHCKRHYKEVMLNPQHNEKYK